MVEEHIEWHSLLRVTAQQAEKEILKLWRGSNRDPKTNQECQHRSECEAPALLTSVQDSRSSHRNSSALAVCEPGMELYPSDTGTQSFRATKDLQRNQQ